MKTIALALLIVSGICTAPSLASAEINPYVRVSGGLGLMNDAEIQDMGISENNEIKAAWNSGLVLEGAFGIKMDMFRIEAAVGYQSSGADKFILDGDDVGEDIDISRSIQSYMANAYADFDMGDITPYVMSGAGIANVEAKLTLNGPLSVITVGNQGVFAWQLGAGVGVHATERVMVDLGYRYFATSDVDLDVLADEKASCSSSNIMLGVRYDF